MARTLIDFSQLNKTWRIAVAGFLTLTAVGGGVAAVLTMRTVNSGGAVTRMEYSDGTSAQSGSLLVGSGTLKVLISNTGDVTWNDALSGSSLAAAGGNLVVSSSGSFIWNENSRPLDARFESDGNDAILFLDGSADRVGIGTKSPKTTAEIIGTVSGASVISGTATSPLHLAAQWTQSGSNVTTGTGKVIFQVPPTASGFNVVAAWVTFRTAGTTNVTRMSLNNVDKGNRHIFTTPVTVDSTEVSSLTAATPFVVNTTNDDVGGGDRLQFNVNNVSTTAPKGGTVTVILRKP